MQYLVYVQKTAQDGKKDGTCCCYVVYALKIMKV